MDYNFKVAQLCSKRGRNFGKKLNYFLFTNLKEFQKFLILKYHNMFMNLRQKRDHVDNGDRLNYTNFFFRSLFCLVAIWL